MAIYGNDDGFYVYWKVVQYLWEAKSSLDRRERNGLAAAKRHLALRYVFSIIYERHIMNSKML